MTAVCPSLTLSDVDRPSRRSAPMSSISSPPTTSIVTLVTTAISGSNSNSPPRTITDATEPNATWPGADWDASATGGSTVDPPVPPTITALLWLPYAVFTIVLLALIALSFVRFHCQRGHQYRRRQAELADKLNPNVQDALRLLPPDASGPPSGQGPTTGVLSRQPNGGAPGADVPEHLNLFVQYSQVHPSYERHKGEASGNGGTRKDGNGPTPSTKRTTFSLQNAQTPLPDGAKKQTQTQRGAGAANKRPLLFTFNINGSMVDIRCGEEERTNTFRLVPDAELADYDCTEEIDLGNGTETAAAADERHYHGNPARSGKRHAGNHSAGGGVSSGRHANCLGVNYHHLQKPGVYAGHGSMRTGHERVRDSSEDEELLLWRKHRAS